MQQARDSRYVFASDLDGHLCLVAPRGTRDWWAWRVYELEVGGTRKITNATVGGLMGFSHRDSEAHWYLPEWAMHVEIRIPGEPPILIHPPLAAAPPRCEVCNYEGPRAMPRAGSHPRRG